MGHMEKQLVQGICGGRHAGKAHSPNQTTPKLHRTTPRSTDVKVLASLKGTRPWVCSRVPPTATSLPPTPSGRSAVSGSSELPPPGVPSSPPPKAIVNNSRIFLRRDQLENHVCFVSYRSHRRRDLGIVCMSRELSKLSSLQTHLTPTLVGKCRQPPGKCQSAGTGHLSRDQGSI